MGRHLKTLLLLLCLIPLNVFSMDVCNFDKQLAESYIAINNGNSNEALKLLQFIKDNQDGFDTTECNAFQRKELRNAMLPLFTHTRRNGDVMMILREMNLSWEVSRQLANDDVAALNLFREYLASKYIWMYLVDKGRMLKHVNPNDMLFYLLSDLSDVDVFTLLSVAKNGAGGVSAGIASSWVYLWIRGDNPFKHMEGLDFDYEWVVQEKEIFVEAFPDSKYSKTVKNLINESFAQKNRKRFLKARLVRYSGGVVAGRSFKNSLIGSVPEVVLTSVPIRVQANRFMMMLEFDISIGDNRVTYGGFDLVAGYAVVDNEKFGVDLYGGAGYLSVTYGDPQDEEEESKEGTAFCGIVGVQVMKRFPVADVLDIVPKIQWMMKDFYYENPESGKSGFGMINQIYAGISFEWRIPIEVEE